MSARLRKVQAARKAGHKCGKCGTPINVGDAYVWWKFRYSGKYVRCMKAACQPTAADMESNEKRRSHTEAEEFVNMARDADDPIDAASHIRSAVSAVESIVESLGESLENWIGTNFEYGDLAESFESTKSSLEDWLSNAEDVADTLENLGEAPDEPGEEPDDPDTYEQPERDNYDSADEWAEAVVEWEEAVAARTEWDAANDAHDLYKDAFESAMNDLEDLPGLDF